MSRTPDWDVLALHTAKQTHQLTATEHHMTFCCLMPMDANLGFTCDPRRLGTPDGARRCKQRATARHLVQRTPATGWHLGASVADSTDVRLAANCICGIAWSRHVPEGVHCCAVPYACIACPTSSMPHGMRVSPQHSYHPCSCRADADTLTKLRTHRATRRCTSAGDRHGLSASLVLHALGKA